MLCPECGGRVMNEKVTLSLMGGGTPLFFRNVPADICERCGLGYPSNSVAEQIGHVLDEEATPRGFISTSVVEWDSVVLWSGYPGSGSTAKSH